MEHKKPVIGVVGLEFGTFHIMGIQANGYEIGAICDINPETLKKWGETYHVPSDKYYTDYRDLLNIGLDIVVLAVPDMLHRPLTEAFLDAGIHVLCEKPLALTHEDLCAIAKAEARSSARFMVGQICRFTPSFIKAKELVEAGTIGEIYFVESEYAHDYMRIMYGEKQWRSHPDRHGVIGGGCHAVDLLRWIAGDPIEVCAYGTHKLLPGTPNDDATISILKFPNQVIGKIFVSTGCKRNYTMRTLIYGTKGTIICDNTSDHLELFTVDETGWTKKPSEIIPVEVNNHNATKEIAAFVDAIYGNKPLMMTADEGARSAAACIAIVRSAKQGGVPTKPDYDFLA